MDFEYFLALEQGGMTNLAILDIDGSYTNERTFCKMENEGSAMRTLNYLKNKSLMKLDYAFTQMITDDGGNEENFVAEVRRIFFNFLKPYLVEIPQFFKDPEYLKTLKE